MPFAIGEGGGEPQQLNLAQTSRKANAEYKERLSQIVNQGHYLIKLLENS